MHIYMNLANTIHKYWHRVLLLVVAAILLTPQTQLTQAAVYAEGDSEIYSEIYHEGPTGTTISGIITTDTTWTAAGSPYLLEDHVTVNTGVTLTIEPGVVLQQTGTTHTLTIKGHMEAIGTEAAPIIFTPTDDSGPEQWRGIAFDAGTGQN